MQGRKVIKSAQTKNLTTERNSLNFRTQVVVVKKNKKLKRNNKKAKINLIVIEGEEKQKKETRKKLVKKLTCDHANMPTFKGRVINHKNVATLQ